MAAARRRAARRGGLAAGAAIAAAAALAPSAQAANLQVTTLTDTVAGSLRARITTANANGQDDVITFAPGLNGTMRLTGGQLPITQPTSTDGLAINGPGPNVITISGDSNADGNPDTRIFNLASPAADSSPIVISGLKLDKGTTNPAPPDNGGAIYSDLGTDLTLSNTTISGSTAPGDQGGGVFTPGKLTIDNSTFQGNSANSGGGLFAVKYSQDAPARITNSTFTGNTASVGAGLIDVGPLTFQNSTVSGNTATNAGGGMLHGSIKYGPLRMSDSTVSGNSAPYGGGMLIAGSKYGTADDRIDRTTVSGNTANGSPGGGAGILVGGFPGGGRSTITHSTISGNSGGPSTFGGGIDVSGNEYGLFDLIDSTVSGNSAGTGAGVNIGYPASDHPQVGPDGVIALENSTIAGNTATGKGGGVYLADYDTGSGKKSAPITVSSTIVADNTVGGAAQDVDRADGSTSGGFDLNNSLIESASGDASLLNAGTSIVGKDPLLGPLANNGGPTLTELPAPNSPVIDKGDSSALLKTDQRGDPRRQDSGQSNSGDGTDVGSVELPPDKKKPTAKFKKKPKKKIKTKKAKVKVKFTFTSNEAGSTFMCKVDKAKFKKCKSPFKVKLASKPGKGKKHTVQVEAIDPAGNTSKPIKASFKVIRN